MRMRDGGEWETKVTQDEDEEEDEEEEKCGEADAAPGDGEFVVLRPHTL